MSPTALKGLDGVTGVAPVAGGICPRRLHARRARRHRPPHRRGRRRAHQHQHGPLEPRRGLCPLFRRRWPMRREGSPFTGLSAVAMKEAADHLTSARMHLVMLLVLLTAFGAVYAAIGQIKDTVGQDPFLFLRLFTTARDPLPVLRVAARRSSCRSSRSRSASTRSTANTTAARSAACCRSRSIATRC